MIQDYLTSIENIDYVQNDDIYTVKNYTFPLDISGLLEKYKDFVRIKTIGENERLERLSHSIYGTMKYWDTILILNGITSVLQLPVSYDRVIQRAERKYALWLKEFGSKRTDEEKEAKREEFIEIESGLNERFRELKYLDEGVISRFDLDVRDLKRDLLRERQ